MKKKLDEENQTMEEENLIRAKILLKHLNMMAPISLNNSFIVETMESIKKQIFRLGYFVNYSIYQGYDLNETPIGFDEVATPYYIKQYIEAFKD